MARREKTPVRRVSLERMAQSLERTLHARRLRSGALATDGPHASCTVSTHRISALPFSDAVNASLVRGSL
jgi:hypothetical protein